jgi:hypothetical protein
MTTESEAMPGMLEVIRGFFRAERWSFSELTPDPALATLYVGENGKWSCLAEVNEELGQVLFYSASPVRAPLEKRMTVAEYVTRANDGIIIGNFEMSFESGEVVYKTSIDVSGSQLDQALVRNLVYANIATMDRYLPGLLSIIYGNVSPGEAIQAVAASALESTEAS